jgi:putative MATE family efflux protein
MSSADHTAPEAETPPPVVAPNPPPDTGLTGETMRLAGPILLTMLSPTLFGLVDLAMVGRVSSEAMAGVAIGGVWLGIMVTMVAAIGTGTQVIVARRFGAGRYADCGRTFDHGIVLGIVTGIGMTLFAAFVLAPLLALQIDDPQIREACTDYVTTRGMSYVFVAIFVVFGQYAATVRRPEMELVAEIVANGLNLFLNWVLIFGNLGAPALGAAGAGISATIARAAGCVLIFFMLKSRWLPRELEHLRFVGIDRALIGRILRIAWPRAIQTFGILSFAVFLVMIERARPADEAAAGSVVFPLMHFAFIFGMAAGGAGAALCGRALGAGRPDLAERYGHRAALVGGIATCVMAVLIVACFPLLKRMGAFSTDEAVWAALFGPVVMVAIAQIIDGFGVAYSSVLQGIGLTRWIMGWELIVAYVFFMPIAWVVLFPVGASLTVAMLAVVAYVYVFTLGVWLKFRGGSWKALHVDG